MPGCELSGADGADAPVEFDVVVVGGGPAGASAAYWLAEAGHNVVVVEKKRFPREKTCGDGLTPRAVRQLNEMGLDGRLEEYHRFVGPPVDGPRPDAGAGVARATPTTRPTGTS